MPLIKIQKRGQFTIPTAICFRFGLADGDFIKVSVKATSIVLTPKVVIDRPKFPNADKDYSPAQRRAIDARLAESDADIKKGRTYGPFDTAEKWLRPLKPGSKNSKEQRKAQDHANEA